MSGDVVQATCSVQVHLLDVRVQVIALVVLLATFKPISFSMCLRRLFSKESLPS